MKTQIIQIFRNCIFYILFFVSFIFLYGCSRPADQIVQSLDSLEAILRQNVESPETLFSELDKYIESNKAIWEQIDYSFDQYSIEKGYRIITVYEDRMRSTMQNIIDLDLEIQDRLSDNPELLHQYMERVVKLGIH